MVAGLVERSGNHALCGRMIDAGWVRVAEAATVVGFIALREGEIMSLYVAQDWRGQGIGTRLLEDAQAGAERLRLRAFAANGMALAFYEARDFAEIGRGDGSGNDEGLPDVEYLWERARG